jgi:RNA polymerase sigma factor (sigma-70 family)
MSDVTGILSQAESGDPSAAARLLPLVYDELRKLAAARLAHEKPGQTLQATELVHEAYLRLLRAARCVESREDAGAVAKPAGGPRWDSRGHFFAAAAEAMRRILVEQARRKSRLKHGGGQVRVELQDADIACHMPDEELLALDEALERLSAEDPIKAKLVELRFFAGMSNDEAADVLGVSAVTAKRYWRYARAWLHQAMSDDESRGPAASDVPKDPGDG